MTNLTYKDAGVDISKAEEVLRRLKGRIHGTHNKYVLNAIGGFGSLTEIPEGFKHPVMVTSTDGVGTKLKIAFQARKHDTVGIDLVAMSVNDVLTLGAQPYFFLDYFACGRLDEKVYLDVISGICEGCSLAGCALVGGETAEMPSFYEDGEYDLAGFAVGFVEKEKIVNGANITAGDRLIALGSSGLHSNGFSLVRKALFEIHNLDINARVGGLSQDLYEELLKPTRIYVKSVHAVLERFTIKGMAHITGGGLPGNIERVLPEGVTAEINLPEERILPIFQVIREMGNVDMNEMCKTFNMGIGFVLVVDGKDAEEIVKILTTCGEDAFIAGSVTRSTDNDRVKVSFCAV